MYLREKNTFYKISCYLPLIICLSSCKRNNKQHAFYFWKSTYKLTETEQQTLKENNIQTLYVRFFDVRWNEDKNAPTPINTIAFVDSITQNVIPVIYIDNTVFEKIAMNEVDTLSKNISKLIRAVSSTYKIPYKEIQFDCDWTLTTKQKYFSLLENIKKENDSIQLSATIRLHQVKYKDKTGVPPVNKAVIMYYNMGELQKINEQNSILNNVTAEKYIQYLSTYPLPYDIALPLFSWTVIFRNARIIALKTSINENDLNNDTLFQKTKANNYIAKRSFFKEGIYIKEGDECRLETAAYDEIMQALKSINNHTKNQKYNIILYHLNTDDINRISHEKIKKIFTYN